MQPFIISGWIVCSISLSHAIAKLLFCLESVLIYTMYCYTPWYKYGSGGEVYWNHFVRPSVSPSVVLSVCPIVSTQYLLNHSAIFYQTCNVDVSSRGDVSCRKLVHYLLWKNGITSFKVKVTAKVQNVSECLSILYLLNRRTFCCQTWYGFAAS